ncbi:hypothetical protein KQI61_15360 [Anaerocolumna aminovalerica]|uniref:hypothetical protein n=1 Tax=Anaerocolumna aminovalerica TaxID=1527 RepID=UPI001C0F1195|nr:hypothetical protein [Anaerocolumna aminovalerica]MBU5333576.1 hypothetical protein [Anaerocolumna aminovalerica]
MKGDNKYYGRFLIRTVNDNAVTELQKLGELIKVDDTPFYLLKSNCRPSELYNIKMVDLIDANGYKFIEA